MGFARQEKRMSFVRGLKCRECAREYEIAPIYVCEFCFGPLEVVYNYDGIKGGNSSPLIKSLRMHFIPAAPP
jgi:threonine synthase